MSDTRALAAMYDAGLFARDDLLASVKERFGIPGSEDSARVLEARVAGGFDFEILPARGFDIGRAFFQGLPLSWHSPITDMRPLDRPAGRDWIDRFAGGLLSTCGLENIGAASSAGPMHGTFGSRPAANINRWSGLLDGVPYVRIEATVDQATIFGPSIRLHRTISADVTKEGLPRLTISDRVANLGPGGFPLQMLYHVNIGAPVAVPGTVVDFHGNDYTYREPSLAVPDPRILPSPSNELTEAVILHEGLAIDSRGMAGASVLSPSGIRLDIRWTSATLPYAHQWVLPTRNRWALGIEPATTPLFGSEVAAQLPAGESRNHRIEIIARP